MSHPFEHFPLNHYREIIQKSQTAEIAKVEAAALTEKLFIQLQQPSSVESLGIYYRAILQTVLAYPAYSVPGEIKLGKQQPSFQEALIETEKRLNFLEQYVEQLPYSVEGLISGGSMSYGRFFNVRGGYPHSSDLDLILVVNEGLRPDDAEEIIRTDLGFREEDKILLSKRTKIFKDYRRSGDMDVLSQKCEIPESDFDISLHIIPTDVMARMIDYDVRTDYQKGHDVDIRLKDYKPASFPHRINKQRDFTGNVYPFNIDEYPVQGGVVSAIPSYAIINNNFIPGMYHNLCSPLFEVSLDRGNLADYMARFQEFMCEAVRDAQRKDNEAELAKSHIRYDIFSPYIKHTINSFAE